MATIAKVLTQDGQAAALPAADGACADASVEFLALLGAATGVMPTPTAAAAPAVDAGTAGDEHPAPDAAGDVVAGSLIALVAAGDPRRAEASGAGVPQTGVAGMTQRAAVPLPAPAVLPHPAATLDLDSTVPVADDRNVPAAAPPAAAAPVAATVLAALQAGQRPLPHAAAVPAPLVPSAVDAAPVSDAITRMAEAVGEIAAVDTGPRTEPDDGGTLPGSSGQAAPGGSPTREAAVSAAHVRTLPGAVGTPAWKHSLGAEVRLMIERGIGTATLRLSPEHLGPVEVRIDLADDSANVRFTATHAETRAALADALPRLRDMLASVGVNLGDASVHRDLPREPERRDGSGQGEANALPESDAESRVAVVRLDAGRGLVDEYA
jgi:flagellar hook-length control protein FliK